MGLRRSFKPTNIVANGNFAKGTTGWSNANATLSAVNNTLSIIGDGASAVVLGYQETAIACLTNKKIYAVGKLRATNAVASSVNIAIKGTTGGSNIVIGYQNSPAQNTYYPFSAVVLLDAAQTGNISIRLYHTFADAATAKDKVMEVKEVMAIDLTAIFGAGFEPDKAWCDLNIPNWFDGTMSSGKIGGMGGFR